MDCRFNEQSIYRFVSVVASYADEDSYLADARVDELRQALTAVGWLPADAEIPVPEELLQLHKKRLWYYEQTSNDDTVKIQDYAVGHAEDIWLYRGVVVQNESEFVPDFDHNWSVLQERLTEESKKPLDFLLEKFRVSTDKEDNNDKQEIPINGEAWLWAGNRVSKENGRVDELSSVLDFDDHFVLEWGNIFVLTSGPCPQFFFEALPGTKNIRKRDQCMFGSFRGVVAAFVKATQAIIPRYIVLKKNLRLIRGDLRNILLLADPSDASEDRMRAKINILKIHRCRQELSELTYIARSHQQNLSVYLGNIHDGCAVWNVDARESTLCTSVAIFLRQIDSDLQYASLDIERADRILEAYRSIIELEESTSDRALSRVGVFVGSFLAIAALATPSLLGYQSEDLNNAKQIFFLKMLLSVAAASFFAGAYALFFQGSIGKVSQTMRNRVSSVSSPSKPDGTSITSNDSYN